MQNDIFYCYSRKLFHYLCAFGEKCLASKINSVSQKRYWTFKKSERLDRIIESYVKEKHAFD